jgi:hypothetical protein
VLGEEAPHIEVLDAIAAVDVVKRRTLECLQRLGRTGSAPSPLSAAGAAIGLPGA